MNQLTIRTLNAESMQDRHDLQTVFNKSPGYSYTVTGKPPNPAAADETFSALPSTNRKSDKRVIVFYLQCVPVGCADIIRDYPRKGITWIGLVLFTEQHQKMSHGPIALSMIMDIAVSWESEFLRLAVIDSNLRALKFWKREKFVPLYTKPVDGFVGRAIVMERALTMRCS